MSDSMQLDSEESSISSATSRFRGRTRLTSLPPEILREIFKHLDPSSLALLSQSCKAFEPLASEQLYQHIQIPWGEEHIELIGGLDPNRVECMLTDSARHLRHARGFEVIPESHIALIMGVMSGNYSGLMPGDDMCIRLLLRHFKKDALRRFMLPKFTKISKKTLSLLLKNQRELRKLSLTVDASFREESSVPIPDHIKFDPMALHNLRSLKYSFSGRTVTLPALLCYMYTFLTHVRYSLASLDIFLPKSLLFGREVSKTINRDLNHLIKNNETIQIPLLRKLRIQNFISAGNLTVALGLGPNPSYVLQELRLAKCFDSDNLILSIPRQFPNLKTLQLKESCRWSTLESILAIMNPLENLFFTLYEEFEDGMHYSVIKRHRKTLKRLWIEAVDFNPFDEDIVPPAAMHAFVTSVDPFFSTAEWPLLEEFAFQEHGNVAGNLYGRTSDNILYEDLGHFPNVRVIKLLEFSHNSNLKVNDGEYFSDLLAQTVARCVSEELDTLPKLEVVSVGGNSNQGFDIEELLSIYKFQFEDQDPKALIIKMEDVTKDMKFVSKLRPPSKMLKYDSERLFW